MAHPNTASSSQPASAQIPPALVDRPHGVGVDKAPKEKKGQGKQQTNISEASPFPLEVRFFAFNFWIKLNLDMIDIN